MPLGRTCSRCSSSLSCSCAGWPWTPLSTPFPVVSGLFTLLKQHRQLRLNIEEAGVVHTLRTPTLFVGNNRLQLEKIGMAESACLSRGLLAALVLRPVGTLSMAWLMLRGAFGRLGDAEYVQTFAFHRIVVTPRRGLRRARLKIATDGEVVHMQAPLEFAREDEPLMLLRPDPGPEVALA